MLNLQKKYELPEWAAVKKAKPPAEDPAGRDDPVAGFEKLFGLSPGQKAAILDFDGFEILFSSAVVKESRKSMQKYYRRFSQTLLKPSEVWVEIGADNLPQYNYIKVYEDGFFEVRVEDGEARFFVLKDDAAWADRQRGGFLVYISL